jgi:hypothetical protein
MSPGDPRELVSDYGPIRGSGGKHPATPCDAAAALLPQFITRGTTWLFAAQIALLGLVHIANCAVVYTSVGTAARRLLRTRPVTARAVTRS